MRREHGPANGGRLRCPLSRAIALTDVTEAIAVSRKVRAEAKATVALSRATRSLARQVVQENRKRGRSANDRAATN
jgi:hypothetical protein